MLTRISVMFSVVAAVALFFASDVILWHLLPPSFQIAEMFAFWCGTAISFLAIVLASLGLLRNTSRSGGMRACVWSVGEFLAFGFLYFYASNSA
ncbi:MAG TPA: hypothetical protein VMU04_24285 [Candidatus Acidoferrum sp.]|nr:hypothetical protein [Candidatus Acidoferrum sp.]